MTVIDDYDGVETCGLERRSYWEVWPISGSDLLMISTEQRPSKIL